MNQNSYFTTRKLQVLLAVSSLIVFFLIFSSGLTTYTISNIKSLLTHVNFDKAKQTVFYFYGLTHTPATPEVVGIRNAYLSNGEYNFVLYDLSVRLYQLAVKKYLIRNFSQLKIFKNLFQKRMKKESAKTRH